MQAEDQLAEWLVRWEEARAANQPSPVLDELPAELRSQARDGLRLLRGFARMTHDLGSADALDTPQVPPDTPRYRFEAFLGRGGMGEVWRGFDQVLARRVALKVLRQRAVADADFHAHFEEEARHISRLEHPSIVPVYDLGELTDGRPFFAMKLVQGQTLAELLAARATTAQDLPRWLGVFEHVCSAVAFAHAQDLIHRDLKPSNVMLGEFGEVLVMDWGIAKVLGARPLPAQLTPTPFPSAAAGLPSSAGAAETGVGEMQTLPGQAKGTPAFMAPEQARGETSQIGKASDVFGLGGILCVILTGQPTYSSILQAMMGDVSEAFARLDRCGADPEWIALAKACLAPSPAARPADAAEVARRVKRYRDDAAARRAQAERESLLRQMAEQAKQATWDAVDAVPAAAQAARTRLRQQAGALLRAEVATQIRQLSSGNPIEAAAARQVLEALYVFPALAGVRDPAALATLPETERQEWQAFWDEVERRLQKES